jgi:cytochrome c-type biogenesis protein CcmF
MMLGDTLLIGSWLITALSIMALIAHEIKDDRRILKGISWTLRGITGLMTLSVLLLTYYFLSDNYNIYYVFTHSSVATPWVYKLSAIWAGQEGSFLLWAWVIFISAWLISEKKKLGSGFIRKTQSVVLFLGLFFLTLVLLVSPFKLTIEEVREHAVENQLPLEHILGYYTSVGLYTPSEGFIDGQGMNPLLMSPWMAVHPPLIFIAYATLSVSFAAALVYLLYNRGDWEGISRTWSRFSWLFLTLGIALGGFWAYEELSYGGYWVWDPVETSSLIPWLTLTGFLHTLKLYKDKGRFSTLSPTLAIFTFIAVIYATFITRSGLLKSVHGYTGTPVGPFLVGIIAVTLVLMIFLGIKRGLRRNMIKSPLISTSNTFYLTAFLFVVLTLVLLWGVTYPAIVKWRTGVEIEIGKQFYNMRSLPFIAFLFLLNGFCALLNKIRNSVLLKLSLSIIGVSLVFTIIKPAPSLYINLAMPILLFALGCVIFRIAKDMHLGIRINASQIAHLGIAFVLIGVMISTVFETTTELTYSFSTELETTKEVGKGYAIQLYDIKVYEDAKENLVQDIGIKVYRNDKLLNEGHAKFINDKKYGGISHVMIHRGISDIYIIFRGVGPHYLGDVIIPITVKIVPGMTLLWFGISLLSIAMILILFLPVSKKS